MHLEQWQSHVSMSGISRKKEKKKSGVVQVKKNLYRSQAGQFKYLRWKTDLSAFSIYLNWPGYLPDWIWLLALWLLLKHLALDMWAFRVMFELDFFLYDVLLIWKQRLKSFKRRHKWENEIINCWSWYCNKLTRNVDSEKLMYFILLN